MGVRRSVLLWRGLLPLRLLLPLLISRRVLVLLLALLLLLLVLVLALLLLQHARLLPPVLPSSNDLPVVRLSGHLSVGAAVAKTRGDGRHASRRDSCRSRHGSPGLGVGAASGVSHRVLAPAGEAATTVSGRRTGVPIVVHGATPNAAALGSARPGAVAPREASATLRQCLLLAGSPSADAQHSEEAELALELRRGLLSQDGDDHDRNGPAVVNQALSPRVQTPHGPHPFRQAKAEVFEYVLLSDVDVDASKNDVDRRAAKGRRRQVDVTEGGGARSEGRLERVHVPAAKRKAPSDRRQGLQDESREIIPDSPEESHITALPDCLWVKEEETTWDPARLRCRWCSLSGS